MPLLLIMCVANVFLPPDGINELDYKISLRGSVLTGYRENMCLYKWNIPKMRKLNF